MGTMRLIMENFRSFILNEEMRAVDCRQETFSTEDAYEKVNDKDVPFRTITQVKKCKLVSDEIQESATDDVNQTDKEKLEKQRERDEEKRRRKRINPLDDLNEPFMSLANGVVSEDESEEEVLEASEKKKKSKPHCSSGNVYHSKEDGKFTDKDGAGSWSLQWQGKSGSDCQSGVSRMKGRKAVVQPCGRANRDGGKSKNKCGTKSKPKAK